MKNFTARSSALSAEQVHAGRKMREEHGTSWYRIGRNLGCDPETIQRALDPQCVERKRASQAKRKLTRTQHRDIDVKERCANFKPKRSYRKPEQSLNDYESTTEENNARRRATKQDGAFIDAMTKAVRLERETCPIGIDVRPSTDKPRLVTAHSSSRTVTGSAAQMCADFA